MWNERTSVIMMWMSFPLNFKIFLSLVKTRQLPTISDPPTIAARAITILCLDVKNIQSFEISFPTSIIHPSIEQDNSRQKARNKEETYQEEEEFLRLPRVPDSFVTSGFHFHYLTLNVHVRRRTHAQRPCHNTQPHSPARSECTMDAGNSGWGVTRLPSLSSFVQNDNNNNNNSYNKCSRRWKPIMKTVSPNSPTLRIHNPSLFVTQPFLSTRPWDFLDGLHPRHRPHPVPATYVTVGHPTVM
jgi:hypothetical protein